MRLSSGPITIRNVRPPDPELQSDQQRARILDREIRAQVCLGARLDSRTDDAATVVTGRPLNDTLHMLLAVLTLGLWLPVWVLMTAFRGEQRRVLRIDQSGKVSNVPGPSAHRRGVFVAASVALFALWAGGVSWFLLASVDPPGHRTPVQAFVGGSSAPGGGSVTEQAATAEQAFLIAVKDARLGSRTADAVYVAFPDQELLHAGRDTCDLLHVGNAVLESAAQRALVLHLRDDGDGWPPEQYRAFGSTAVTHLCPEKSR